MNSSNVFVQRFHDEEIEYAYTLTRCKDGNMVDYPAIQHAYKECLEHGLTLKEAIELVEKVNGK